MESGWIVSDGERRGEEERTNDKKEHTSGNEVATISLSLFFLLFIPLPPLPPQRTFPLHTRPNTPHSTIMVWHTLSRYAVPYIPMMKLLTHLIRSSSSLLSLLYDLRSLGQPNQPTNNHAEHDSPSADRKRQSAPSAKTQTYSPCLTRNKSSSSKKPSR